MSNAQRALSPRDPSTHDWVRRHQSALLLILAAIAIALRLLLAVWSPTPYGYVFDFYHEAIQKAYTLGRLPTAADCWQCYHPPLLTLLGLPLYSIGKRIADGPGGLADPALHFVTPLSLVCGAITSWFAYRILRLYRFRGTELVLGTGLILVFPCLFISSYGIEADILLTALMTAFFYYLIRFFHVRRSGGPANAIAVGTLAGLACATKYNGLFAPVILVLLTIMHVAAKRRERAVIARRAVLALTICALVGSWQYIDNLKRYETPLFANGSALQGFAVAERPSYWRNYDFSTLRIGDLVRLNRGEVPPAHLTDLPFYGSVWTTLHAMAWGDMTMFSDPSRHGFYKQPYPAKALNPLIASSVLVLGLVPGALAVAGFLVTFWRPAVWPLAVSTVLTLSAYAAWFLAQESWALKTKYILFLLPAYVVFALLGLRWVQRFSPVAGRVLFVTLAVLLVAAHVYLLDFATS